MPHRETFPQDPDIAPGQAAAPRLAERLLERLGECAIAEQDEVWFQLRPEVFCIPHDGAYLLYSPLQDLIFAIDRRTFAALLVLPDGPIAQRIIEDYPGVAASDLAQLDSVPRQEPEAVLPGAPFAPARVMLSLTTRCQCACRYCYIHGGQQALDLPWPVARAALQFALAAERTRPLLVEFHGEGEPTLHWDLLTQAVRFVEMGAARRGIEAQFQLGTNGVLSPSQVQFLADHRVAVTLSMDGLRDAMETQRPLRGGGSSFDAVVRTLGLFDRHGLNYDIRCTVGPQTMDGLADWLRFLGRQTGCRRVALEPMADAGRAAGSRAADRVLEAFPALLQQAQETGARQGIAVHSAELQLAGARRSFCSGYGPDLNLCVSAAGAISSCYGVLDPRDPRAATFCYGHIDRQTGALHLDPARLARLQGLAPAATGGCRTCFARWSCAGGCRAMRIAAGGETESGPLSPAFCRALRAVTRSDLARICLGMAVTPGPDRSKVLAA